MENFEVHILRDIVEHIVDNRGKSAPTSDYGAIPLIEINALGGFHPNYSAIRKYVTRETYNVWFRSGHPQCNDILLPTVGTIGITSLMDDNIGCIAQNIIALHICKNVCPEYVYYYLKSEKTKQYLLSLDIGGVQPSIKVPHLLSMPIPLPPYWRQKEIAELLLSFDKKIELNNRINHNLEEQAKALYKSWFVDFEPFKDGKFIDSEMGLIPEGWEVKPMRTILEYSKKSINPQKYPETIFTHYSLPAYDNSKEPEVQKGYEIMSNKFVIEDKMILFSKLNPRIKRIWYIDDIPMNSICSTEFIAYKALDRNTYPYCWCYLNSDMFYDKIMSSVNGATGSHQRFHAEETLDICFPYNMATIQSFSTLIKPMLGSMIKNEAEIRVLKKERDYLLPYLMSGKTTVNI